jgi:hypothetical protein
MAEFTVFTATVAAAAVIAVSLLWPVVRVILRFFEAVSFQKRSPIPGPPVLHPILGVFYMAPSVCVLFMHP